MTALRIAILNIRLVMRIKAALFFTFVFPLVWLFVFEGIFAHGNPQAVLYFFGPVVTLNIMGSAFWGLGLQAVMQRERGSLRRLRLAPISSASIVAANLLANYLLELPTIALLVLCAKFIFHMPLTFGWGTLFVLVTVGTFGFSGFGLTIASIANTMQEAQIYNNLIWVTLLFLSGATIPLPLLPGWIQRVATFLPATYLVTSFQSVMIQGEPLLKHLPEMLALVLSGIFGLLFAWKLFRWEKEETIPRSAKAWALVFIVPFAFIGFWMNLYANPTKAWASTYSMLSRGPMGSRENSEPTVQRMFLEDFESQQAESEIPARWHVADERTTVSGLGAKLELISSGAAGSGHALRVSGVLKSAIPPAKPRGAVVCEMGPLPADAQAQGVEFWARGDRHVYKLHLFPPDSTTLGPTITWVPSGEWQSVKIPAPEISSQKTSAQPKEWKLEIAVAGEAGKFSLDIDQIGLYGLPPAPRTNSSEGNEATSSQ
jgi:ABC-2 type transport system permease protein